MNIKKFLFGNEQFLSEVFPDYFLEPEIEKENSQVQFIRAKEDFYLLHYKYTRCL